MGRPYRTQAAVRRALLTLYDTAPDGYPGNDDLGTLSAWYVFGALGLYPEVPGVGVLALASPLFERAEIRLPHRRRALIVGHGHGPYVQSLRLDGRPHGKPWTTYCALARGATLSFRLGRRPNRRLGRRPGGGPALVRSRAADAEGCLRPMRVERARAGVLWALAGLTALGLAVRFASLGLQSYHHDEVITAMRVIPGSFGDMLHSVKVSESNPPLYYALAWGWAKAFGTGELGLRSLTALFGAATVPVGYLIGRQLATRSAGLVLAALIAVNPMLIWYSQEARSYALLVFFGALSMLFFVRALDSCRGRDLALWALASALALCSHYFAIFPVGIEALWLLVALRARWRLVLPALGAVGAVGLALLPLANSQTNPTHIGWIENSPLPERLWETAVSFLVGETGHVIAEAPRERYALIPIVLVVAGMALVALWGSRRERRGAGLGLMLGLGIVGLTAVAALVGKDYVVERNLLPALVPLLAVAAAGFAVERARRLGLALAVALCAYWLAFDVHVTQTPNLQRPDFRTVTDALGPPRAGRRAIVTWKLAADPVRFYLHDRAVRLYGGEEEIDEIAVLRKPLATGQPINLPPSFHQASRVRADRLTLNTYVSDHPVRISFKTLRALPTGFGAEAVLIDGSRSRPAPGSRPQSAVGSHERLGIRRQGRGGGAPSGKLVAAAQVRDRRRLRVPDQSRRLRSPCRQPRRPPRDRRDRRLLRRRDQQLPLESLLDLRPRRKLRRLSGDPLLRGQPRRAGSQPGRARGPGRGGDGG